MDRSSQGFSSDKDFNQVKKMLLGLDVVEIGGQDVTTQAAKNFSTLRLQGVTIRKTIVMLIATRCIKSDYALLYSDCDFDPLVEHLCLRFAMAGA